MNDSESANFKNSVFYGTTFGFFTGFIFVLFCIFYYSKPFSYFVQEPEQFLSIYFNSFIIHTILYSAFGAFLGTVYFIVSKLIKILDRRRARFVILSSLFLVFYIYQYVFVTWNLKQPEGVSLKDISRISFAVEIFLVVLLVSVCLSYAVGLIYDRYLKDKLVKKRQFPFRVQRYIYAVFVLTFIYLIAKFNYHDFIVKEVNLETKKIPGGNETKVVLLGLDSASWRVMTPLIKEGKLPNIERMLESSAYGNLITHGRALTPPVWTSMATGKTRDKHKIVSWTALQPGMTSSIPVESGHRQGKAIWNILSELGYDVGLINFVATYPPEEVSGYNITNLFWKDYSDNVYPNELAPTVEGIVSQTASKPSGIDHKLTRIHRRIDVLMDLFNVLYNPEHKLTIVYTHTTDYVSHFYWCYFDPENFRDPIWGLSEERLEKYKGAIGEHWERVDLRVGDIFEKLGEDTIFLIASDHGSNPSLTPNVHPKLNELLSELGFLHFDIGERDKIDFTKTVAYSPPGADLLLPFVGININLTGSEEGGIISQDDKSNYEDKVVEALRNLTLDETGERIFQEVNLFKDERDRKARDMYSTSDIIVHLSRIVREYDNDRRIYLNGQQYDFNRFLGIDKRKSGRHSQRGMLMIKGKNIRGDYRLIPHTIDTPITEMLRYINGRDNSIRPITQPIVGFFRFFGIMERATTLDITPTLLYLMGLPVGRDMDGKVIVDAITPEFLKQNPITYIDTYETASKAKLAEKNRKVDKKYMEYLKSLGYIN